MVAYTSPDCLPYFECTDPLCVNTGSLCEPSTVWCDFATAVEAKLDEFDAVAQRTAVTVPMVWLETSVPLVTTAGVGSSFPVAFTSVVVDTDNMANLDENNNGFTIVTPGLYEILFYAIGLTETAGSNISSLPSIRFTPSNVAYAPVSQNELTMDFNVQVDDVIVTPQIQQVLPLQAGQLASTVLDISGTNPNTITYSYIMVSATWIGDLP